MALKTPTSLWYYVFTLMYLNSSLNPLIYSWKIRGIRQAVVGILRNTFPYFVLTIMGSHFQ